MLILLFFFSFSFVFLCVGVRKKLQNCIKTKKSSVRLAFLDFARELRDVPMTTPADEVIAAEVLSRTVGKEIGFEQFRYDFVSFFCSHGC
jgi:hypothetical protein